MIFLGTLAVYAILLTIGYKVADNLDKRNDDVGVTG